MKPILEVNGVHKAFGRTKVLNSITFHMYEGERICLLGPSGCGKSTLLQMVAGLLDVDGGVIQMDGRKVSSAARTVPPEERPINMVFQDYALWPHMTIKDNIEYGMRRKKVASQVRHSRLTALTDMLHLDGLLGRLPAELSGGQQQRVGIARALATEPKILLLDEPLSNLDVKLRSEMRTELAGLMKKLSITALYVTHDMMEAFALADRILVLNGGLIEQLAAPREMFEAPATPWVAELIGYHNHLIGKVVGIEGDAAVVQCGDQIIRGIRSDHSDYRPERNDDVSVMLHTGDVHIERPDQHPGADRNRITTEAIEAVYEGEKWRCLLRTADGQRMQVLHDEVPEQGSDVPLSFAVKRARVYKQI